MRGVAKLRDLALPESTVSGQKMPDRFSQNSLLLYFKKHEKIKSLVVCCNTQSLLVANSQKYAKYKLLTQHKL